MTKELTLTEFRTIIREEAMKLKRRLVLENEKKQLQKELDELLNESCVDECGEIEEGIGSIIKGAFGYGEDAYRKKFIEYAKKYKLKPTNEEIEELVQQMIKDKGEGYPGRTRSGKLIYLPSLGSNPHGAGAPGGGLSTS